MGLNDLEWVREALRGPATRTWWGRAPDGALVRVTGVCFPGMEGGGQEEVERAFVEAVGLWGAEAAPPLAVETTADGRVVALCRVDPGAETLADRLQGAVLEPEDALDCVMQIAERLASWHERGLSHGYLRPETVLCQEGRVALLEPRLHAAAADAYCRRGASPAADPYAAPESDRFAADALAADVFALGTLLVFMLVGRPPRLPSSGGLEGTAIYEALPGPLQRTVAAALHPDPMQRLPGAQKFGLYLRVHRMWAASWDWAPLAALAATPTDSGSAAAVPAATATPVTEFSDSVEAAPEISSAPPEGSPVPREPEELPGHPAASIAAERHPEPSLTGASPPPLPVVAAAEDTPLPPTPGAHAQPFATTPSASITTPGPPLPEVSSPPRTAGPAGTETEWPAWLPRPRLEIATDVAEAPELAETEQPGPPSTPPVPVEETEIDSAASPALPLWAEGGWGLSTALAVPDEEASPESTTMHSVEVGESSRSPAIPTTGDEWDGALSPLVGETPERPSGHLIVDIHNGRHQERIMLEGDRAAVGRPDPPRDHYPEIDLSSDDAISRRHAEFRRGAGGWLLVDLGSTNGTRLNGEWLEPHQEALLRDGDQIELGAVTTLRIHFG